MKDGDRCCSREKNGDWDAGKGDMNSTLREECKLHGMDEICKRAEGFILSTVRGKGHNFTPQPSAA